MIHFNINNTFYLKKKKKLLKTLKKLDFIGYHFYLIIDIVFKNKKFHKSVFISCKVSHYNGTFGNNAFCFNSLFRTEVLSLRFDLVSLMIAINNCCQI